MITALKRILITACVVSVLTAFGVLAASAADKPTLTVENVEAEAGSDVEVKISLSGNEIGILGMMVSLSYDDGLTLESVVEGSALSTLDFTPGKIITANPLNLGWDGVDADKTNGTIAILTFAVPDNAKDKYSINLSYDVGNIYDDDFNDIDMAIVNGSISVNTSSATEPEIIISNYDNEDDSATFTVELPFQGDIYGKILVATYNDGKSAFGDADIYDAASTIDITVNTKDMEIIKIMWWEDTDKCTPISKAVKIDLIK